MRSALLPGLPAPTSARQAYSLHRFRESQYREDTPQVISQNMQTHFGTDVFQGSGEEVRVSHPVLECSEHVLDGAPPYSHRIRHPVETSLDGF